MLAYCVPCCTEVYYGGALSDETHFAHRAQLQDMCRGNARCELCPVTARLRPASLLLGRGGHSRGGHRSRTGTP